MLIMGCGAPARKAAIVKTSIGPEIEVTGASANASAVNVMGLFSTKRLYMMEFIIKVQPTSFTIPWRSFLLFFLRDFIIL